MTKMFVALAIVAGGAQVASAASERNATGPALQPANRLVLDEADLQREGRMRILSMLPTFGGVSTSTDGEGTVKVLLRGLNTGRPTDVDLRVDGLLQVRADGLYGASVDAERLEVLRGRADLGAGDAAFGGALRLTTKLPELRTLSAGGHVELGSFARRHAEAVINLPLGETQALRAVLASSTRGAFVSGGSDDLDQRYLRVRYRWQPSDELDVRLTASHQRLARRESTEGGLLYTGRFVPYSNSTAIYSAATGQAIRPEDILLQTPVSYTFAAGSVLGPTLAPLQTTTTRSFQPQCTPVGFPAAVSPFTSGKVPSAPLVAMRGCPVTAVAVRDNIPFYLRSNPWDDGAAAVAGADLAGKTVTMHSFGGEVLVETRLGQLSLLPGALRVTERIRLPGTGVQAADRRHSVWQLALQLRSPSRSRIAWQAGLHYRDDSGAQGPQFTLSYPNVIPPALAANQSTTDGTSAATGVRTLSGSCYVFSTGNCLQLSQYHVTDRRRVFALHGDLTLPLQSDFRVLAGFHYQREQRQLDQLDAAGAGNLVLGDDPLAIGGYVFSSAVPGTNCATAVGAAACRVQFVRTDLNSLHNDTIYRDWNGDVTIFSAGSQRTVRAHTPAAALRTRFGAELDVGNRATFYGSFDQLQQPGGIGAAPGYTIAPPLGLHTTTLGMTGRWFGERLDFSLEYFSTRTKDQPAGALIDHYYTINPAGGTNFSCPSIAGVPATARLGPLRTNADTCFNYRVDDAATANTSMRGLDLAMRLQLTANGRIDLAAEWLTAELTGAHGLPYLTPADVYAAAAANTNNPSSGTSAALQLTTESIASGLNYRINLLRQGGRLPQAPSMGMTASYAHSVNLGGGRLTPRLRVSHKSAYWIASGSPTGAAAAIFNATEAIDTGAYWPTVQPGYHKWDFFLDWQSRGGKWQANVAVINIRNTPTLVRSAAQAMTTSTVGNVVLTGGNVWLAEPRQYSLSFTIAY